MSPSMVSAAFPFGTATDQGVFIYSSLLSCFHVHRPGGLMVTHVSKNADYYTSTVVESRGFNLTGVRFFAIFSNIREIQRRGLEMYFVVFHTLPIELMRTGPLRLCHGIDRIFDRRSEALIFTEAPTLTSSPSIVLLNPGVSLFSCPLDFRATRVRIAAISFRFSLHLSRPTALVVAHFHLRISQSHSGCQVLRP